MYIYVCFFFAWHFLIEFLCNLYILFLSYAKANWVLVGIAVAIVAVIVIRNPNNEMKSIILWNIAFDYHIEQ